MADEFGGGGGEAIDAGGAADEDLESGQHQDGEPAGTDGAHEPVTKPGEGEPKVDGRNNPDAIRKHLAEMKADPAKAELAKAITDGLGKKRGYEAEFPTVREAREVKQLIESAGGREAVTAAIASHATMQQVDTELAQANPAVVKRMFDQAPEGMVKLVPSIMEQAAKANPEAFKASLAPHVAQMLAGDGMTGALNALIDAFNTDNKAGMQDVLGRILQYYKSLMQGAAPKGKDPDREAFEKEKTEYEKGKETERTREIFNSNLTHSGTRIDAALASDAKRLNLGPAALERLRQDVWRNIEARRNADNLFKTTLQSKFASNNAKIDAVKHLNDFTDKVVKAAVDEEVIARYGERKKAEPKKDPLAPKGKPGAPAGKPAAVPVAGAIKIAAPLSSREIDYDDPRTTTKGVMSGVAVRKSDKKLVQW
jgi:hypothetical protein